MGGNREIFWIGVFGEFGISEDVKTRREIGGTSPSAGTPGERPASLDLHFEM